MIITCWHWRRCIPKHPGASPLAHALLPSGWIFRAVLDEHEEINAEDLAALVAALPAGTGPLRLVWCLPPQLWAGFTARWVTRQAGWCSGEGARERQVWREPPAACTGMQACARMMTARDGWSA